MAVSAARVTVGTSATALTSGDPGQQVGSGIAFRNMDATATVFIGGPGVTAAAGYPLEAGEELSLDLENTKDLPYAITASGSVVVAVLRAGV